jgi:hypothetical protein
LDTTNGVRSYRTESLDDADVIRSKILLAFERAEAMASTPQALEEVPTEEIRLS